jgi:DNA-directed RNA polymerase alpha subunit
VSELSDTFRNRYYNPGYVYIAGSLSNRVLKIGSTIDISKKQRRLQLMAYGSIEDWVLLYYVWVTEAGRVEYDTRRTLKQHRQLRTYVKDGHRQKGIEIVNCSFRLAFEALKNQLTDAQFGTAIKSMQVKYYEFEQSQDQPLAHDPPSIALTTGIAPAIYCFIKLEQIQLSARTLLCLKNEGLRFLGEVAQLSAIDLLRIPNFEQRSLDELEAVLAKAGLHLQLNIPSWHVSDIDAVSKLATKLLGRVDEYELSARTRGYLNRQSIVYLAELVQRSESEILRDLDFRVNSLNELNELLMASGLRFGMNLSSWPNCAEMANE